MSLCIPTYMLASSLIDGGMNWWQAILTVFMGNSIVLVPMVLNGHAGARYGIPFPIFARSSFGIRGANVPAMLRAIVACGWFGIQTWIGGCSLYELVRVWFPSVEAVPQVFPAWCGLETGRAIAFLAFWAINMYIVYLGIESIRKLLLFKAVFLPLAALCLLVWAIGAAKGLGPILAQPVEVPNGQRVLEFLLPGAYGNGRFLGNAVTEYPRFHALRPIATGARSWAK